jgi:hypothetical protein
MDNGPYNIETGAARLVKAAGWLPPKMLARLGVDQGFIPFAIVSGEATFTEKHLAAFGVQRRKEIQRRRAARRIDKSRN